MALISSTASSTPALPERPSDAAPPVSGSIDPIGIGSPLAAFAPVLASAMTVEPSAAAPKPSFAAPERTDRRLWRASSSFAGEFDLSCVIAPPKRLSIADDGN